MGEAAVSVTPYVSFFDTGMQYYAVGRYSAFAGANPVAGNILHHAIEMLLKGALARKMATTCEDAPGGRESLKDSNHKLDKLWAAFKKAFNDPGLSRHDYAISELSRFEDLGRPNMRLVRGMRCGIDIKGSLRNSDASWGRPEPLFELFLEDIDELVDAIFTAAGVDPNYFTVGLLEAAMQYPRRRIAANADSH